MDNTEIIPIAGNRWAVIDKDDMDKCSHYHWHVQAVGNTKHEYITGYKPGFYKQPRIRLHRFILGLTKNDAQIVHHINGNTLDNRKENLQIMTRSEHSKLKWGN